MGSLVLSTGDFILAYPTASPSASGYGWHLVTTAAAVSSSALRLNHEVVAPTFASGSQVSKLTVAGADTDTADGALSLVLGDLIMAFPQANPVATAYSWHMVSTGAAVSSSALRVDGASAAPTFSAAARHLEIAYTKASAAQGDKFLMAAVQLERKFYPTSYADGALGTGYQWLGTANNSRSLRGAGQVSYLSSQGLNQTKGSLGFWFSSQFDAADSRLHVFFDMAVAANQNRLLLYKDSDNKLKFKLWDGTADSFKEFSSTATMSWTANTWHQLVATYSQGGVLKVYLDGSEVSGSTTGSGTGQLTATANSFFVGCDYAGANQADATLDELFARNYDMSGGEVSGTYNLSVEMPGVLAAIRGMLAGTGSATTDATPGVQTSVAHGLGQAPSFVEITEKGAGTVYLSAASDATNFYVKGTAASLGFDWRAYV